MWRWIFGLFFLGALGVTGWWFATHSKMLVSDAPKVQPMPTTRAAVRDAIEETLTTTGEVRPAVSTEVKSEVSGVVKQVRVNPGDHVKRDDLLITLDPKELKSQLDSQVLSVKSMEMRQTQAQQEWDRNVKLWAKKLVPEKDYLDSKTAVDLATNEMAVQEANVENIRQQITKTEIHAPHDGIVLNLDAQEGAVIVGANSFSAGSVLMEVADMSRKRINVDINEIDVMKVKQDMKVEVTFDSVPGLKVEGKVTFVSPSASGSHASSGGAMNGGGGGGGGSGRGTAKMFPVTISMDNADERIRAGITATVKIPVGKAEKAIGLPIATVFIDGEDEKEQHYVYVRTGPEKFERRDIKTGVNDHQFVQVTEGLKADEIVAKERPKDAAERSKTAPQSDDWN